MRTLFLPVAIRDISAIVGYLLDEFAYEAAERFPDAVLDAVSFVEMNPLAGAPSLHQHRSWAVTGFSQIRIYYQMPAPNTLQIARILHDARDLVTALQNE